jgi:uncharacterized protein (DUF362 family)
VLTRKLLFIILLAIIACSAGAKEMPSKMSKVYVIKTADRISGLQKLFETVKWPDLKGKSIAIKPNFNSDDPFPATTHLDTLEFILKELQAASPGSIILAERSGMGETAEVLKNRGVYDLAERYGVKVIDLDSLPAQGWVKINEKGNHWRFGFLVARVFREADYVINLPCLKTHRFGGDFTMSLKNNVGAVAKWKPDLPPYNYMIELHTSRNQRLMIAEVNRYIPCNLVIMDGMEGFADQGPDKGRLIKPGLLLASDDRVAVDAAGVAVLRIYGTTKKVSGGRIFDLEQIRRAAELGIGAASPDRVEIISVDKESEEMAAKIRSELKK